MTVMRMAGLGNYVCDPTASSRAAALDSRTQHLHGGDEDSPSPASQSRQSLTCVFPNGELAAGRLLKLTSTAGSGGLRSRLRSRTQGHLWRLAAWTIRIGVHSASAQPMMSGHEPAGEEGRCGRTTHLKTIRCFDASFAIRDRVGSLSTTLEILHDGKSWMRIMKWMRVGCHLHDPSSTHPHDGERIAGDNSIGHGTGDTHLLSRLEYSGNSEPGCRSKRVSQPGACAFARVDYVRGYTRCCPPASFVKLE